VIHEPVANVRRRANGEMAQEEESSEPA